MNVYDNFDDLPIYENNVWVNNTGTSKFSNLINAYQQWNILLKIVCVRFKYFWEKYILLILQLAVIYPYNHLTVKVEFQFFF